MDYSSNVNPHGPPKSFKKLISANYKSLGYPADENYFAAKRTLAALHRVLPENIIIASGAAELADLALRTLKPRRVLLPTPSSELYQRVCKSQNCEVIPFYNEKENEFDVSAEKLIAAAENIDMIIISNPNNPTGRITDKTNMGKILDYCQLKGIYLIIDEGYADFVSKNISSIGKIDRYANVIVLRTLSNYFALAGLGLSYCISCRNLTELMYIRKVPHTVCVPSLLAFTTLLGDAKYIKKTKAWLMSEPERFYKKISTLGGVTAYKPYANYIFIELEQIPAAVFCERLESKGVRVCNCNKMGVFGRQYIRIAILDKRSNEKFLDIFSRCLL